MKGLHRIEEDITDLWGIPYWEWMAVGHGFLKLETLLKSWAKWRAEYPEEAA